ncbi:MAG: alpha/beta hydrolase [Acidobacteriaceae bacterium]|nr:alpha/beta hydrolase [Acidobacteriaceae bacterium]
MSQINVNGTQLYFETHGRGDPLLLLHGFSGAGENWASALDQLQSRFQLIVPDLRGHGRSATLPGQFRHRDAAVDMFELLEHLGVASCSGIGISCGGNVLLHMATMRPDFVRAMVVVSSTPYFPAQARAIMRRYAASLPESQWEVLRRTHAGGDPQIRALLASTTGFADSHDDLNFTPPHLATIRARTLIVQGDRDPLYPVELSLEMARAIPQSSLWVLPNAGHGPVLGNKWQEFLTTAANFLSEDITAASANSKASPPVSAPSVPPASDLDRTD